MNTNWADLSRDGRRLERIIKDMDTKQKNTENNEDLKIKYIDTLIKITNQKVHIAEIVLNVKRLVQFAEQRTTPIQALGEITR